MCSFVGLCFFGLMFMLIFLAYYVNYNITFLSNFGKIYGTYSFFTREFTVYDIVSLVLVMKPFEPSCDDDYDSITIVSRNHRCGWSLDCKLCILAQLLINSEKNGLFFVILSNAKVPIWFDRGTLQLLHRFAHTF